MGKPRPMALVTGGARRVGRAICLELARAGCDIALTYKGSEGEATALVEELRSMGAAAAAHRLVLDDVGTIEAQAAALSRAVGRLDVLVHNASTYEPAALGATGIERLVRDYLVNAAAPVVLTKAFAPMLAASAMPGGGAVVALADIHALGEHGLPRREFVSYAMSKAALVEMVRSLAREMAPKVRVNAVALGVAAWPESGKESDAAAQDLYLKRVPLGRAGTVENAAGAVRWLAMGEGGAGYVTGEVVRVDGGRSMM